MMSGAVFNAVNGIEPRYHFLHVSIFVGNSLEDQTIGKKRQPLASGCATLRFLDRSLNNANSELLLATCHCDRGAIDGWCRQIFAG